MLLHETNYWYIETVETLLQYFQSLVLLFFNLVKDIRWTLVKISYTLLCIVLLNLGCLLDLIEFINCVLIFLFRLVDRSRHILQMFIQFKTVTYVLFISFSPAIFNNGTLLLIFQKLPFINFISFSDLFLELFKLSHPAFFVKWKVLPCFI